jgi:Na+/serine symporter
MNNTAAVNPENNNNGNGMAIHWKILIALALGAIAGYLSTDVAVLGTPLLSVYEFGGQLFLNALKMLIVPLIASSIALGVAGLGNTNSLGSMGFKTALFYVLTTGTAILTGLIIVNLVQPGIADGEPAADLLALAGNSDELQARLSGRGLSEIPQILLRAVPQNILAAAAGNEMLALIFFSAVFGYFMSQIEHELAETLYRFTSAVFETMLMVTHWVMSFAPYGVFALVAAVVAKTGFDAAGPLVTFSIAVIAALLIHFFLTLPAFVRLVARRSPTRLFHAVAPALLTAFSTSSSSATLPVPAGDDGQSGAPRRRAQQVHQLRAATGRHRQHERHGALRMHGGDVHRAGLRSRTQPDDPVPGREHRADHLHRRGRSALCFAGRHRHHFDGHRPADRGDRCAAGLRPDPGHVAHRHQRIRRCLLHGHRCPAAGRGIAPAGPLAARLRPPGHRTDGMLLPGTDLARN